MSKTVATLLAESLEAHDVDRIFCVPGESYVGLTSALIERGSPHLIVCRHESGAGFMAIADGELRGGAGVAIVSRGPGVSNAMVALHSAYHDATPFVLLIGHVERRDIGRLALQEQNYSRLRSEEHTSELQSLAYLVCRLLLEKKKKKTKKKYKKKKKNKKNTKKQKNHINNTNNNRFNRYITMNRE